MLKKILRGILKFFSALLLVAVFVGASLYATGYGYILRAFTNTYLAGFVTANINDHIAFATREITAGAALTWPKHANYNRQDLSQNLVDFLADNKAAALLVIKDGQLLSEHYFAQYHQASKTNSFSMSKTVLMLLVGIAIEDGIIKSLDQKLVDFLPEFANDQYGRLATIGQLSNMTSGYAWDEGYYSPLSPTVQLMYGYDVEQFLLRGKFNSLPGERYYYSSASTQLLGIVLTRALQKSALNINLSQYLSKTIWQPLGMNNSASWHLDGNKKMELAFCCINTNARNFAKLGQLMLAKGRGPKGQIIPSEFIDVMLRPQSKTYFGHSIWLSEDASPKYFWFSGHLGQYIIVIPDENLVVVKLGEERKSRDFRNEDIPFLVKEAISLSDSL